MLVLRLLIMVLSIICLMDGHAEVSSSTTKVRKREESPAVNGNVLSEKPLDRKKKKKPPKKKKTKKPKKSKKPKPVITTTAIMTTKLKTTTSTSAPTFTSTTPKTTTKVITSTATTTTTTAAKTSTTIPTTTTTTATTVSTSVPSTTMDATTANTGSGGECKATNGQPCVFPFKDGNNKEYNECKNEGGRYFWCATNVYESGKYMHWSYCPNDGSCPIPGDGECRATNKKPCVFPFKDGDKEYSGCADYGGKYFWCATGTNSAGKYTSWSECPKDGSCPLPTESTTPMMTSTPTTDSTTIPSTGTSNVPDVAENKVVKSLKDLVKEESKNDTMKVLQMMNEEMQSINEDLQGQSEANDQRYKMSNHDSGGRTSPLQEPSPGDLQDGDFNEERKYIQKSEFVGYTVNYLGSTYVAKESSCCSDCKKYYPEASLFEYWAYFKKCWCYKKGSYGEPQTRYHTTFSTGECVVPSSCGNTRCGACGQSKCQFGELKVFTTPIGQGDSTIIKCKNGDIVLVDMGLTGIINANDYKDWLKSLKSDPTHIKKIFLTHGDQDHILLYNTLSQYMNKDVEIYLGGPFKNFGQLKFRTDHIIFEFKGVSNKNQNRFTYPCGVKGTLSGEFYGCQYQKINQKGIWIKQTTANNGVIDICKTATGKPSYQATVMAANYYRVDHSRSEKNENSLVFKITPANRATPSMLFMGDFEEKKRYELLYLADTYYRTSTDTSIPSTIKQLGLLSSWLMVPHHGASTTGIKNPIKKNGFDEFFKRVSPIYAVISANICHKSFGHPRCLTIDTLLKRMRYATPNANKLRSELACNDNGYPWHPRQIIVHENIFQTVGAEFVSYYKMKTIKLNLLESTLDGDSIHKPIVHKLDDISATSCLANIGTLDNSIPNNIINY